MLCRQCRALSVWPSSKLVLPAPKTAATARGSRHACRCYAAGGAGFGPPPTKGFGGPAARQAAPAKRKQQRGSEKGEPQPVWIADSKACPCASGRPYAACCERFHSSDSVEPTAEALMRARFSAYVKGNVDYIVRTTHPDNPATAGTTNSSGTHTSLHEDAHATWRMTAWQSLKILRREDGSSPDEAFVTFRVTFKFKNQQGERQQGTRLQTLEERSRFLRIADGRWLYRAGEVIKDWHSVYQRA